MKKVLLFLLAFLFTLSIYGEVEPGENILVNGIFENDQNEYPDYWDSYHAKNRITTTKSGGPSSSNSITLFNHDEEPYPEVSLRQADLSLVAGEIYKISAYIRTKDFTSPHYGIVLIDDGWVHSAGISGKVQPNQDWTYYEEEFKLFGTPGESCVLTMAIFACKFSGELEIADVKLEAISEAALKGSKKSSVFAQLALPKLVPWQPRLNWIPADQKALEMHFFGILPVRDGQPGSVEDYSIRYSAEGIAAAVVPLGKKVNTLNLESYPEGDHVLKLEIISNTDGQVIYSEDFDISIIDIPSGSAEGHKRLNNLVSEVINTELEAAPTAQHFDFQTARTGWIFIALEDAAAEKIQLTLNGNAVIKADTDRLETFREIPAGKHTIEVTGAISGGRLIVRTIPEIFNYCPGVNNGLPEVKPFDWEFQKRYVLPAVTTQNGGNIPEANRPWLKENGYKWLANVTSTNLKDGVELASRLEQSPGFSKPHYDGVTCDEQFYGRPTIAYYTSGLKCFKNPNDRLIYTWIVGKPTLNGLHHDFIAASINASRGRGKLLYEKYMRTQPTLKKAQEFLEEDLTSTMKATRKFYPNVMPSVGMIFGNFNQVPILSLAHHPAVDYKYYLDMQINIVANNPEFKDLGCIGYWGSYYGDHELHRWSFMLMRHYCVEGKTTMLSDEYGLSYIPGHIVNGDFKATLEPWTATGNIESIKFEGFASASQNRWSSNSGVGDTMAAFTKTDEEESTLSQIAQNLVPGKFYCLQFCTVDVNDMRNKVINPRRFGIDCILKNGAEIVEDQSWVHVDQRIKGRYAQNDGVARVNLHHIVFKALAPEVELSFTNAAALKGEVLGLNYVMLTPYIPEE